MNDTLLQMKDDCRKKLIPYTLEVLGHIPAMERPLILDLGCGTGVSSLALIEAYGAAIVAVDADRACLTHLDKKIRELGWENRIRTINASALDPDILQDKFDIVLAEGLLNSIGFSKGFPALLRYLKPTGYLVLHEEVFDKLEEDLVYRQYDMRLIYSLHLSADVWKTKYFDCLESAINRQPPDIREKLLSDCSEIGWFKNNPMGSAYYILQKR